jgi:hypothetical protein
VIVDCAIHSHQACLSGQCWPAALLVAMRPY